ncbi:hypothetical protein PQQ87_08305 [Paraburkholderia nemoris]|uniref:hypothetical protein n=1 Tax=Paraburkholderia nemoris TaxID=2793076 RepID=UPI0038BCB58D
MKREIAIAMFCAAVFVAGCLSNEKSAHAVTVVAAHPVVVSAAHPVAVAPHVAQPVVSAHPVAESHVTTPVIAPVIVPHHCDKTREKCE